ncbi:hypothetical protein [Streptomyces sp. MJM8645]|uniref:hypothetical protein n=1 Tax=Streptomycetaceae TaxID=2062 RepID=UPI0007AFB5FB|nr:hypothetical protein [Streptomyces sp. MJM8645]
MRDQLHPATAQILAAQHAAGLPAVVAPADGGGDQVFVQGPGITYALIDCDEVFPEKGEKLEALHCQLYAPDEDDDVIVVFHRCTDPACGQPECGEGASLDPAPLAAALADALNSRRPAYIPNSARFFNDEGLRYSAYFNPVEHEVTIRRDKRSGISDPFDTDPATTLAEAEDVVRGLGYARATEWAGPDVHSGLYCYLHCHLLRPLA